MNKKEKERDLIKMDFGMDIEMKYLDASRATTISQLYSSTEGRLMFLLSRSKMKLQRIKNERDKAFAQVLKQARRF